MIRSRGSPARFILRRLAAMIPFIHKHSRFAQFTAGPAGTANPYHTYAVAGPLSFQNVSDRGPKPLLDAKSHTKSEKFTTGTRLCLSRVSAIVQIREAPPEGGPHCRCVTLSFQSVKDSYILRLRPTCAHACVSSLALLKPATSRGSCSSV